MARTSTRLFLLLALGLTVGSENATAQNTTVRGTVIDSVSGEPLPGVNVFLSETMMGGVTDDQGRFEIEHVPPGAYEIVASMVGFERGIQHLEIASPGNEYDIQFEIHPTVAELGEVKIVAERPRGWRRNLRRFEQLFIGTGPNASETEIMNPFVLDFEERDGVFHARASEPLIIVNRALGYEITFILTDFRLDEESERLHMHGPFSFRELEAIDSRAARQWQRNRERTYRGSLQHVLASVIHRRTLTQDITVKLDDREDAPYSEEEPYLRSIEGMGLISATEEPYLYSLSFPRYLYVAYRGERSWIELSRGAATIHESGYVYAPAGSPGSLTVHGRLANRRIADLLPREYGWSAVDAER